MGRQIFAFWLTGPNVCSLVSNSNQQCRWQAAQIETIQLNNESNAGGWVCVCVGGGSSSVDLFECHVWWLLWFNVSLSPAVNREPWNLLWSSLFLHPAFLVSPFISKFEIRDILYCWNAGRESGRFDPSNVAQRERAIGKNWSFQSKCCGSSLLLVLVRARLWCSISNMSCKNSKWNKTKVSISLMPCHNSVCQRICAPSPNAALSLCINFTGSFVYKGKEQKKKKKLTTKSLQ